MLSKNSYRPQYNRKGISSRIFISAEVVHILIKSQNRTVNINHTGDRGKPKTISGYFEK